MGEGLQLGITVETLLEAVCPISDFRNVRGFEILTVRSGNPEHPHQRKHAFDLGEYGAGYMANSLSLGCDCKGSIHYLDAEFPTQAGSVRTIKQAICIHEEDDGILFKHSDFRDNSSTVTRARKLLCQSTFTAGNYVSCPFINNLV